jgi:hypothetical protein
MKPECWPCICLIAHTEHFDIKGCWFNHQSLFLNRSLTYTKTSFLFVSHSITQFGNFFLVLKRLFIVFFQIKNNNW